MLEAMSEEERLAAIEDDEQDDPDLEGDAEKDDGPIEVSGMKEQEAAVQLHTVVVPRQREAGIGNEGEEEPVRGQEGGPAVAERNFTSGSVVSASRAECD